MEPSTELKELMLRAYEASAKGDLSFIESYLSHQDGVLIIGTDPNVVNRHKVEINREVV